MRAEIIKAVPPPPPPAVVQITMSYDEARALFAVTNWSDAASKAVAAGQASMSTGERATRSEIKEMLRDLWEVLKDAGVR